ncbi:MAG TPA: ABC transporter permease [Stellaceae bacterium]|nr:ABC transporter permease [Stellaceae bacterium]
MSQIDNRPALGKRVGHDFRLDAIARGNGAILALIVILAFNAVFTQHFLSLQTLNVNLTQVCTIVIVAIGMNFVIATGGIDLSVGSLMAISGVLAPLIFLGKFVHLQPAYVAVAVAIGCSIACAGVLGLFNGWLVSRFKIQPIVATLVLFISGRGIAQILTDGNLQTFHVPEFQWIGLGKIVGIPIQVVIMLVLIAFASWVIRRTTFGRNLLAVGGNEKAATLSGLPVKRIKLIAYMASGLCAGFAGLVVIAINSASDANLVGLGMELDAIAAVAVGGTALSGGEARIFGTLVGALIIQLIRYTLLANGVPDAAALVVKAAIIAFAVWGQQTRGRR